MKYIVNIFLYAALGVVLATAGINVNTWQYWAVFACVFGVGVNAMLW